MSGQIHVMPPIAVLYHEEIMATGVLAPAPPLPDVGIDPAHVSEIEQVFSEKQHEADKITGLIGMYTGVMLLHDLAMETFASNGELDEEEEPKPRLHDEPEE